MHLWNVFFNLWTDERNRLRVEVIKAEFMTNFNYTLSCDEFCEFLETESGHQLVKAAKSEKKIQF